MKQWDIVMFPFSKERRHPAVIISNDERCQNPDLDRVNALLCTSVRVNRPPMLTETLLDGADGLDWKTLVRCDLIHLLQKDQFQEAKGNVSEARRTQIGRKLVEVFRLPL